MRYRERRHVGRRVAPQTPGAHEDRMHLLQNNLESALMAWGRIGAPPDVVLIIADATDPVGAPLAAELAADVQRIRGHGKRPTVIAAVPRSLCATGLDEISPGVAAQLGTPAPAGKLWVVVSCGGGTSLALVPAEPGMTVAGAT